MSAAIDHRPARPRRVGVAIIGLGGAVATTAIAGVEMLRAGANDVGGLPLRDAAATGLADYKDLVFGGWDLSADDLSTAAANHNVLTAAQHHQTRPAMEAMRPWPAVGSAEFCRGVTGRHLRAEKGHRAAVAAIAEDLRRFQEESRADGVVMINLASTERWPQESEAQASLDAFERALDADDAAISPAMLYAYAAMRAGVPYGNFTPSQAADIPALVQLSKNLCVPVAGKDG
jgi:myo-inositol-1-phosphate synthase